MDLRFDYDDRYVVFLDILGFKDKVAKIELNQGLFELLIELPQVVADTLDITNRTFGAAVDAQGTAFSDSIVISASASVPTTALYTVVTATVTLCQKLLHQRAVARGGLARGPCHHKNGIVFGKGMIDAYLLEQSVAKVPRVAVVPEIAKEWLDSFGRPGGLSALKDLIMCDSDNFSYIDVFHFPDNDSIDNTTFAFFKNAAPNLCAMLDEPGIGDRERQKLLWLASKYNAAGLRRRLCLPQISAAVQPP
jgi:hypothetical protein